MATARRRNPHPKPTIDDGYSLGRSLSREVSERIRSTLAENRITQVALAKKIGMRQPYLADLLGGRRPFQRTHIQKVAIAFGLEERELTPSLFSRIAPSGSPGLPEFLAANANDVTLQEAEQLRRVSVPFETSRGFWAGLLKLMRRS